VTGRLVRTNMAGQIATVTSPFGNLSKLLTPRERLIFGPHGADSSILVKANILKSTWSAHAHFSPSFADYGWLLSLGPSLSLGHSPNAIYYYRAHNSQMSRKAKDMSEWADVAGLWVENISQLKWALNTEEKNLLIEMRSNPNISLAIAFPASLVRLTKKEKQKFYKIIILIQKMTQKECRHENILIQEALFRRGFIVSRGGKIRYWGAGMRMLITIAAGYFYGIKPRIGK